MVKVAVNKQTREVKGFWNPAKDQLDEDEMFTTGSYAQEPDVLEDEELVHLEGHTRVSLRDEIDRIAAGRSHVVRVALSGELQVEVAQ